MLILRVRQSAPWQNNSKLWTLIGSVCCRYCPSMDKNKGLCQAEAQTISRCGSAFFSPEKPVENMRQVLFRYTVTGILDNNNSIFGRFFDDYVNQSPRERIFQSIIYKIGKNALQLLEVTENKS